MKKITYILLSSSLILASCGTKPEPSINYDNTGNNKLETKQQTFVVKGGMSQNMEFKANVVSNNIVNITSSYGGIVKKINCNNGQKVKKGTLLAIVQPDWTDPNIKNLINQKKSLQEQIENTKNIIQSTKSNFQSNLNSLKIQKTNLEKQIAILKDNLKKLKEQKGFGTNDLKKQLETLQIQLKDLKNSKEKLEQSKYSDISKVKLNIKNTTLNAKSLIKNILLQIDEVYGISDTNKHKNDAFENYLSAKNTALKENIKSTWIKFNAKYKNIDNFSAEEISYYLQDIDNLVQNVKDSIKDSVSSRVFPQTQIDAFYKIFDGYDTAIINLKNGFDNLIKSLNTIENNYDTQILNLQTQINATKNNIENIKSNKLSSYTTNVDIQINQLQSQIDNLQSNYDTTISQISSIKLQENINIKQLNNQLKQLKTSLNTININLSSSNIYSSIDGKVKLKNVSVGNKIGPNTLLCQIMPDKSNLKLKIFSPLNITIGTEINFKLNNKEYFGKIINKLPYQDQLTQNYIYETSTIFKDKDGKTIDLTKLLSEGQNINVKLKIKSSSKKIYIPLEYIQSTILGDFVLVKNNNKIEKRKVKLGEINGTNVEILSGLNLGEILVK